MTTPTTPISGSDNARPACPLCGRANAPNRTACLYCGAALPIVDAAQQRPSFRQMEEWEQGFNVVFFPHRDDTVNVAAAAWFNTTPEHLSNIVVAGAPLPLARVATEDEALLACGKMQEFGMEAGYIADNLLGLQTHPPRRARALEWFEGGFYVHLLGGHEPLCVRWRDIKLFVSGRLWVRSVDAAERSQRRGEGGQVVETSETSSDEAVLDVYTSDLARSWRFQISGFDFSCLGEHKELLAARNFDTLCEILYRNAPDAAWQDGYERVRALLANVWPSSEQTASRGWQRGYGAKLTRQVVTTHSNENQFTRFSRFCFRVAEMKPEEAA
jgi:hypothetical protein